jgi:hypothetical protein
MNVSAPPNIYIIDYVRVLGFTAINPLCSRALFVRTFPYFYFDSFPLFVLDLDSQRCTAVPVTFVFQVPNATIIPHSVWNILLFSIYYLW